MYGDSQVTGRLFYYKLYIAVNLNLEEFFIILSAEFREKRLYVFYFCYYIMYRPTLYKVVFPGNRKH